MGVKNVTNGRTDGQGVSRSRMYNTISYLKQIVTQLEEVSSDFVMASLILFFSLVFIQILAPARGYAMGSDQLRQVRNLKLERKKLENQVNRPEGKN